MNRLVHAIFFALVWGVLTTSGIADEFLGEEDAAVDDGEAAADVEAATKKPNKAANQAGAGGDISVSLGLGATTEAVHGHLTVGYGLNRFASIDTTAYYTHFDGESRSGEEYGPEVDLVLRLPNPTIVTPFVGAGPGYLKWARQYEGEVFDDSASATGSAFGGLSIRLTKHFGIKLERRQVAYLGTPPRRFSDRTTREEPRSITTTFGFHAMF